MHTLNQELFLFAKIIHESSIIGHNKHCAWNQKTQATGPRELVPKIKLFLSNEACQRCVITYLVFFFSLLPAVQLVWTNLPAHDLVCLSNKISRFNVGGKKSPLVYLV